MLAANLHRLGHDGVWRRDAPAVRTVGKYEGMSIRKFLIHRIKADDAKARGIILDADKPGTMVFEYAHGAEFQDLLTNKTKHSEPKTGGRRLRQASPARLFKDEGFMRSLGGLTAIDIFTGNYDRLVRYNPGNFKVDQVGKTILLIDNVQLSNEFAFKRFQNLIATLTSVEAYQNWTDRDVTKQLAAGDFDAIAKGILDSIKAGIDTWEQVRAKDKGTVYRALGKSQGWLVQGIREGWNLLGSLPGGNLAQLTGGMAPEDDAEVQASIRRRLAFLFPHAFPGRPEQRFALED